MSYTPTMDELREAWLSAEFEERDSTTSDDDLRAEFDRALTAHDAEVRAGVVAEEPEWQYSYVERIGRHGDVHERVTFDSMSGAQQYLRANAESIIDWNREVRKRDRKVAGVEKRQMNIGDWMPVQQEGETRG